MNATSIQTATVAAVPSVEITAPRWLTGSVAVVWVLALTFVIASIVAVRDHRDALKSIAVDSAKSVIAAEQMAAALADMDANAANGLLSPLQRVTSVAAYNKARGQMTDALVDAAQNITFNGEKEQIKLLAKESGVYGERVESAFTLQNSNPAAGLTRYLSAALLMDKSLLPGARNIDKINRDQLDASYQTIGRNSTIQLGLVWLAGLGLLVVLLRIQFFLSERMRRTLNPLCIVSMILAAGFLLYTHHALTTVTYEIKVVKADAFESIHALWQTKAKAYEANAQESRFLLDRQFAASHEKRFNQLAKEISNDPEKLLAATIKTGPPADATGFLADELRNVTFSGERAAAAKAVDWWTKYIQIDLRIRALELAGQHDQALQLCLGEEANQSNWAFNGFIGSLDDVLKINQSEFDQALASGFNVLSGFEITAPVMGLLAALACLFGVLPRIREYSA